MSNQYDQKIWEMAFMSALIGAATSTASILASRNATYTANAAQIADMAVDEFNKRFNKDEE